MQEYFSLKQPTLSIVCWSWNCWTVCSSESALKDYWHLGTIPALCATHIISPNVFSKLRQNVHSFPLQQGQSQKLHTRDVKTWRIRRSIQKPDWNVLVRYKFLQNSNVACKLNVQKEACDWKKGAILHIKNTVKDLRLCILVLLSLKVLGKHNMVLVFITLKWPKF